MSQPTFVIVSGIDGSGKTSIIDGVRGELESRSKSTLYVWLRYNHTLVKPIHALCRLVGLSRKRLDGEGKIVWRHEFYRCRAFCGLYIFLTYLDSLLGELKVRWKVAGAKVDVVICDRWVYDILIDLAVGTRRPGLLRGWWLRRFEAIMPRDARQYLIKRDTKSLLDVRPEYNRDREFVFRRRIYERLEKLPRVAVVENDRHICDAVEFILNDLEKEQRSNAALS